VPPTTVEGIERYLGGGSVKGIGPVLAKKLVERFGAEVLGIIETRAADLESVDGIGPKRRVFYFVDLGKKRFSEFGKEHRQQQIKHLKRKAASLGYEVTPIPAAA
jgi:5'-3' exonuclease